MKVSIFVGKRVKTLDVSSTMKVSLDDSYTLSIANTFGPCTS